MAISEEERNRAEDFLNAFNAIEAELKRSTEADKRVGFAQVARMYVDEKPWWRGDYEAALAFADLRNVIVHKRYKRHTFLSVPSADVVFDIQNLRDRLLKPRTAFDAFRRDGVVTVEASTSLQELLKKVKTDDFTQFPVYKKGDFIGLVTSNGVTRWLAERVRRLSLVEFDDYTVGEILEREEARPNWAFIRRSAPVEEIAYAFRENPQLEAVFVTQNGREAESLLGIATRWDMAALTRQ